MKKKLAKRKLEKKNKEKKSIMRKKYLVTGNESVTGGRTVFGIRYDEKKKELYVAGPKVFEDDADEIIETFFGNANRSDTKFFGARVSWTLSVEEEEWKEGLLRLKEDFFLETVRSFGRLTR